MSESTYYLFSESDVANHLVLQQDTVLTTPINTTVTVQLATDTVPPKPTFEQIRYWRWLREKKLLIGNSRYIQPKNEIDLVSSQKTERYGLGLSVREKDMYNTDWLTILFVVALVLFATVRYSYSKYLGNLFQSLFNSSTTFRMFREKNYTVFHGAFRLDLLFYFVFSVFVFQVLDLFQLTEADLDFMFFTLIWGLVVGYFVLKKSAYYILGLIFERVSETSEYLFIVDNFHRMLGIVLFPMVALINYYPAERPVYMVVAGLFVAGIFYTILLQRGIFTLLKKQFSIFYLFLYLCILEILPLLLIYKIVVL